MKKSRKTPRFDSLTSSPEKMVEEVTRAAEEVDSARLAGMQTLRTAQAGKLRVLERDGKRLEARGDRATAQTLAARERIERMKRRAEALDQRSARDCRDQPEPGKDEWILHGFVRKTSGRSVPGANVLLEAGDRKAVPDGKAQSDEDGYYRLTLRRSLEEAGEAPVKGDLMQQAPKQDLPEAKQDAEKGRKIEYEGDRTRRPEGLRLSASLGSKEVYEHPVPIRPRPRTVTYLDIQLGGDDDCNGQPSRARRRPAKQKQQGKRQAKGS